MLYNLVPFKRTSIKAKDSYIYRKERSYYISGNNRIMTASIRISTLLLLLFFQPFLFSQKDSTVNADQHKHTNALINESSPYLLQHAHNPVNWLPWGDEAFEKAKTEDKLVLISIGYSSCHWCHVMEHESFEDDSVAALMNEHFVCIKVDREERPDVDQIYMTAVQLMTNSGGWPLNCFTLPDGRPVYGGTYFPKNKWMEILGKLHQAYSENKQQMIEYADKLTQGIRQAEVISVKSEDKQFSKDRIDEMVDKWKISFDTYRGGPNRAPKFPLPNNYEFLMHYGKTYNDSSVLDHVELTMKQMAMGGIYDQIGGGFARYSVDADWKVPHFEKMLYDNAQLVSLYSHAYQRTKDPMYKKVVYQTLDWVKREMTTEVGSFYSALDADSEGEEGKFYVWDREELKTIGGEDYELLKAYYNLSISAQWEGHYILHRRKPDSEIADEFELSVSELRVKIDELNKRLMDERSKRIRPGLDDKSLTSWNCMMTIGYLDAYQVFGEESFLQAALKNVEWLNDYQLNEVGELYHTFKEGQSKINGFLEDYAFAIEMFVKLYEVTFAEPYLDQAKMLCDHVIANFCDEATGMFYFTAHSDSSLVARKMDFSDNVIPSTNSVMAINLWKLGCYFDDQSYKDRSTQMLANIYPQMTTYGSAYSNWGILALHMIEPYYEVAITGPEWKSKVKALNQYYIPNKILMGGTAGRLPLLEGKFSDKTTIFVCVKKSCKLPVDNVDDALSQMK